MLKHYSAAVDNGQVKPRGYRVTDVWGLTIRFGDSSTTGTSYSEAAVTASSALELSARVCCDLLVPDCTAKMLIPQNADSGPATTMEPPQLALQSLRHPSVNASEKHTPHFPADLHLDLGNAFLLSNILSQPCKKCKQTLQQRAAGAVRRLTVSHSFDEDASLAVSIAAFTHLQEARLFSLHIKEISGNLRSHQTLRKLVLHSCRTVFEVNVYDKIELLEEIHISHSQVRLHFFDADTAPSLRAVVLDHCEILNTSLHISNLKHLTSITIRSCSKLTTVSVFQCFRLSDFELQGCFEVRKLTISSCEAFSNVESIKDIPLVEELKLDSIALKSLQPSTTQRNRVSSATLDENQKRDLSQCDVASRANNSYSAFFALSRMHTSCRCLRVLDFSYCRQLMALEGIWGLPLLEEVGARTTPITRLSGFQGCPALRTIDVTLCRQLEMLDASHFGIAVMRGLSSCSRLKKVIFMKKTNEVNRLSQSTTTSTATTPTTDISVLQHRSPLNDLASQVEEIDISHSGIQSLSEALPEGRECRALRKLFAKDCRFLSTLDGISAHASRLSFLDASRTPITSLQAVRGCLSLQAVTVDGCMHLADLDGLQDLQHLKAVHAVQSGLVSLDGLTRCPLLRTLVIADCRQFAAFGNILHGLEGLPNLEEVDASFTNITSIAGLEGCRALRKLRLEGCQRLATLDGIECFPKIVDLFVSKTCIRGLLALQQCFSLQTFHVEGCRLLESLHGLEVLQRVREVNASFTNITSTAGLSRCRALRRLCLVGCQRLTSLDGLGDAAQLEELDASRSAVTSVDGIQGCCALKKVVLSGCRKLASLDGFECLISVEDIDISHSIVSDVSAIRGCHRLQRLLLHGCRLVESLHGLEGLPHLEEVNASSTNITSIAGLSRCRALRRLCLVGCQRLTSLDGLGDAAQLEELDASRSAVTSVDGIQGCYALKKVVLSGCRKLASLDGFECLISVEDIDISHSIVSDLFSLQTCTFLKRLVLHGCCLVESLNGLDGLLNLEEVDVSKSGVIGGTLLRNRRIATVTDSNNVCEICQ